MARGKGKVKGSAATTAVVSNPYPQARTIVPKNTECELCERTILTKDWSAHKNSTRHKILEEKEANDASASDAPFADTTNGKSAAKNSTKKTSDVDDGFGIGNLTVAEPAWGDADATGDGGWGEGTGAIGDNAWDSGVDGQTVENGGWGVDSGTKAGFGNGGGYKKDRGDSSQACFNCGETGHMARDCSQPRKNNDRACYNCGETGHMSKECSQPQKGRGGQSSGSCYACGEAGHISRYCPQKGAQNERSQKTCYNCKQPGHISRDCPTSTSHNGNGNGNGNGGYHNGGRGNGGYDNGDTGGWGNDNTAAASGGWDTAATDDQWGGNASATTGW